MLKILAGLAVMMLVFAYSTFANASCVCQCFDGQFQAACTNTFDIPPICTLRTCPFGSTPKTPPIGGRSSCRQDKVCDIYGHCEWKQVCQ